MNKKDMLEAAADASLAIAESGVATTLDNLPMFAESLNEVGLTGAAQFVADGFVGAIAPGLLGAVVGYRQRRAERNLCELVASLENNMDEINDRLERLESSDRNKFMGGLYCEALLDNIVEESEIEMVQQNVNAFINLMNSQEMNDSFALTLFDDLSRLNSLDIRVLRLHGSEHVLGYDNDDDYFTLIEEEGIEHHQYESIRKKLLRLGLLQSKNESRREKNLEVAQKCLSDLVKQLSLKSPRIPNEPRFERIWKSDSYSISDLGNKYLRIIGPVS